MAFYTAQKTAQLLGVTTRTLERWRSTGKFVPEIRTAGGHSRYSQEQIELAKKGMFQVNKEMEDLLS